MNVISGRVGLDVGGVRRELVCDMNAATVLYEKHGEFWTLWLIERFVGRPVKLPNGQKGRQMEKMPPAELVGVLYALLATDREVMIREDNEADLRRSLGLADLPDLQIAVTRAVLASFGVPGKELEVAAGATGEPHGSERAETLGAGTQR
jgi:hypothetical protein